MTNPTNSTTSPMRLVVFPAKAIEESKDIFSSLLGTEPFVDGNHYVGYQTGAIEVGLDPNGTGGPVCYWDVDDIDVSVASLVEAGATVDEPAKEVGGGMTIAKLKNADGITIGLRQSESA